MIPVVTLAQAESSEVERPAEEHDLGAVGIGVDGVGRPGAAIDGDGLLGAPGERVARMHHRAA